MIISSNCVVTLHYSLNDEQGKQVDASHASEPLVYLHGTSSLLPGLEEAIAGHRAGDDFKVTVQPEQGYGVSNPELIHHVPLEAFSEVNKLEVGMQFELESTEGHGEQFMVTAIEGDQVTVDANHSLAGKILHFEVRIETVRAATDKEIDAGYAQQ
ncbi:MAG: peptidylprolyl isomerase [Gammaproteobacteria bacterium]|jgi:FKBP-type peptidyl-prolyl cis-trans isomerase SlyD|nr:peptidylprolyl isomerase [Gammaproteobacteria bacterium]